MAREYVGYGAAGLKDRSQMKAAILARRDKAKRERQLEEKVAKKQRQIRQGRKRIKLTERDMDQFRSLDRRIRRLQAKVAEMRTKAKKVERSKTGNVQAARTYRRVAAEYSRQVAALQKKK